MLSLTESVWDFIKDALWDTYEHAPIESFPQARKIEVD